MSSIQVPPQKSAACDVLKVLPSASMTKPLKYTLESKSAQSKNFKNLASKSYLPLITSTFHYNYIKPRCNFTFITVYF